MPRALRFLRLLTLWAAWTSPGQGAQEISVDEILPGFMGGTSLE